MLSHSSFAVLVPLAPLAAGQSLTECLVPIKSLYWNSVLMTSPGSSLKAFFKILSSETPPELLNEF